MLCLDFSNNSGFAYEGIANILISARIPPVLSILSLFFTSSI